MFPSTRWNECRERRQWKGRTQLILAGVQHDVNHSANVLCHTMEYRFALRRAEQENLWRVGQSLNFRVAHFSRRAPKVGLLNLPYSPPTSESEPYAHDASDTKGGPRFAAQSFLDACRVDATKVPSILRERRKRISRVARLTRGSVHWQSSRWMQGPAKIAHAESQGISSDIP